MSMQPFQAEWTSGEMERLNLSILLSLIIGHRSKLELWMILTNDYIVCVQMDRMIVSHWYFFLKKDIEVFKFGLHGLFEG